VGKNIKYVGLANIFFDFMGEPKLHKELIQEEVNAGNLYSAYQNSDIEKFAEARDTLKKYLKFGSSKNVATMLKNEIYIKDEN
ncbi:MAG: lipid-A-disaccharide synthase, partial [Campylobacter sp.]|nr:lipid-A-disaccharide synthase [Campylobacter sp.]